MSADDLKLLKQYMHVDHDDDDALIQKFWLIHVRSLESAGITLDAADDGDPGWLAAAALTLQSYDGTPLAPGVRPLINQLKLNDPAF